MSEPPSSPSPAAAGSPAAPRRSAALALAGALIALAVWAFGTFLRPVQGGWIHVFLALAVMSFIRWVVKGPLGR